MQHRSILATLLILAIICAIGPSPASARYAHPSASLSFGPDGTSASVFLDPLNSDPRFSNRSLAIDQAHHRLYVTTSVFTEGSYPTLYGYDISTPGSPKPLPGFPVSTPSATVESRVAVDNSPGSEGNIYFRYSSFSGYGIPGIESYSPSGLNREGFPLALNQFASAIAVDSEGHLWSVNATLNQLEEYAPNGSLIRTVNTASVNSVQSIMSDQLTGELYISTPGGIRVVSAADEFEPSAPLPGALGEVFDSADRLFYVSGQTGVNSYNMDGGLVEKIGSGGQVQSVAIDESTGYIYVSNGVSSKTSPHPGQISIFPGVAEPEVTTGEQIGRSAVSGHVDPNGSGDITSCKVEFIKKAALSESQPEIQELSSSGASGGYFSVSAFGGQTSLTTGTLTAGSTNVTNLVTATGSGSLTAGSSLVSSLSTTSGVFSAGASISGAGIAPETKILSVEETGWRTQLQLSAPASASAVGVGLVAQGPYPVRPGNQVSGAGIVPGTTVVAVSNGTLTLSQAAHLSGSEVALRRADAGAMTAWTGEGALTAGSPTITGLVTAKGVGDVVAGSTGVDLTSVSIRFLVGEAVEGLGIPPGTTVQSISNSGKHLVLSHEATESHSGATIVSSGPTPFFVGSVISGTGIPADTKITSTGAGTLTMSYAATESAAGVSLGTAPGPEMPAASLQEALESLNTITAGHALVTGPNGGPYTVKITSGLDVSPVAVDSTPLTPVDSKISVATIANGGTGWNTARTTPCEPEASDESPITASQDLTATLPLQMETPYLYRIRAGNGEGSNLGLERELIPHWVDRIETGDATPVTRYTATLTGTFVGENKDTHYYFEWGSTQAYGNLSTAPPGDDAGATIGPTSVASEIADLTPDTLYHFRVVASNAEGISRGRDRTFESLPAVPNISTEPADHVAPRSATLNASFTGDGTDTQYHFEWGKTKSYGSTTPVEDAGSEAAPVSVSASLEGLELETTYHFRFVATNGAGTSFGKDQPFTTLPAVAGVLTEPADPITLEQATLHGSFNASGEDTTWYFEWGPTLDYGNSSAHTISTATGTVPVTAFVREFRGFTTYHYRLVAENGLGTAYGEDRTFKAADAVKPTIRATTASAITRTSATVEAGVTPNRWATLYLFEYGDSSRYGISTPTGGPLGTDIDSHMVSDRLTGLSPGTVYHFRMVAFNFAGTSYGPDTTFVTPDIPSVESSTASSVGRSSARLGALVAAGGSPTEVRFEYGTSTGYGQSSASIAVGSELRAVEVGTDVLGLSPGTTYHFRVVATNAIGTTTGPDLTFSTEAVPKAAGHKHCRKGFVAHGDKCRRHRRRHKRHRHHHRTGSGRRSHA